MKSSTVACALAATAALAAAVLISIHHDSPARPAAPKEAAVATPAATPGKDGKEQVVVITAKGGYTPEKSVAKAGVPLTLKIKTEGTFDCSTAVRIEKLDWYESLAPTDEVEIPVPAQAAGSSITGVCQMGMYHFEIDFE
jgi:hypothetical protein